ncbi:hypothetical protein H6P81_000007 [Aristolochia fimbriata]|uniref:Uncharacterized protein n=5 Tax=Magnoliopsida TaxID=3398 RepID=A0AAV7F4B4_ARIFI|nr:hypothetical protein H6P81_000007 [Aristolochia fimbriata]
MDWCGSSTPRTPEYRTMNQERHERKAYWLVVRPQFLTGKDTKRLCPPSLWDGRAVGFHVVKELNNENRWRVPDRIDRVMGREPSLSRLYYRGLWGSRNRRALILGWAYYLDAFSSYPLRTWLPSVYRGHDNWYTRGKGPLNALTPTPDMDRTVSRRSEPSSRTALMGEQPNPWNILQPQVAKSRHRGAKPSRRCELLGKISLLSLGNFYPLSDGPSTRHRRITKADFRPCSTGGSCSQAPFCLCTRGPISVRPEGNLCTPPLPFGRPTPHRNCLPETVPWPVGGISLMARTPPPAREAFFAFHLSCAGKAQSQSQGTVKLHRGLSVQVQVVRIFTDMSISPSLSPRQCPDRYAFRAGRNLPDKEFRYLRTVIVTAAVHRGFGRRLPCHQVTNFLDLPALGRRQPHTWSYDFAETCVFGKQSPGPGHCDPLCEEAPLLPKYPFVEGRSSFSWEYGMGYFSAVAPGTRTLARGIFSTPSYPALKKQGFRGIGFSPMFALLKPTFSLPLRPHLLARVLSSKAERSPTDAFLHPTASADRLAPFIFGAKALDQLAFATAPVGSLNQATAYESPAHSSTGTRSEINSLLPLLGELTVSCSISLPDGVLFTFPSRYYFAIGHPGYLALQGGPCGFTQDSTCPMLLGSGVVSCLPMDSAAVRRLTYSGISGSMLIFNSPKHFVACYALPRLWVPRYPP